MSGSTVWKGHLTFGLVSAPIRLLAAARTQKVSFSSVNPVTGARTQQKLFDAATGQELKRGDLVKVTELDDGREVYLTDADLAGLLKESSSTMQVLEFVKLEEVDPVFFDASYYVLPDGKVGDGPYHLLEQALRKEKRAAVAKMIRSQREYLVLIRAARGGLTLHTLFYDAEVREVEGYGQPPAGDVDEAELALARRLLRAMTVEFEPGKYSDAYRAALLELIQARAEMQTITTTSATVTPPAGGLKEALKDSIKAAKGRRKA